MDRRERIGRVAVALLAVLVVGTAEAQKRRLPSRTEEIPDTESGRPAASAERPTFKGRLLIFGPPSLPVTPPPEHVKPAPAEAEQTAKPAPAPAPVIAAPAPKPEPAPVVTPIAPPPAPVAAPIPAAPPPVAKPAPAPEPAPPAVVAVPKPKPEPAPVVIAPQPKPAPVVAAPPPKPEPVPVVVAPPPAPAPVAAPAVREPIVREPIVRTEAKPAPAPPRQEAVAMAVPSASALPSPAAPVPIEMKLIESIFTCLAPGLPQDWRRAWVEITDQGGGKEKVSKFRYTNLRGDDEGEPLVPCNAQELTRRIVSLNDKLPPDRRAWSRALLVIESDGEYELSYEYPK